MDKNRSIENKENRDSNEIVSRYIRCGRRTFFFDLKTSKKNNIYLTLIESKRHFDENGVISYEKHKILVPEEDLKRFHHELGTIIEFIEANPHLVNETPNAHRNRDHNENAE
ncbi:MAG: PUR family DNA/RNA-binding protein [Bacteroidales bacterium]|nr:PUR family DNA/RNA-binding protein [Bacteroidales bacterium]